MNDSDLIIAIKDQIDRTVQQAVHLQNVQDMLEKLIFIESILFVVVNSVSTRIGAADIDEHDKKIFLNVMFGVGIVLSFLGMFIKWTKTRHEKTIEAYRGSVKEIVGKYGKEVLNAVEASRMKLPSKVFSTGFFRGLSDDLYRDINITVPPPSPFGGSTTMG